MSRLTLRLPESLHRQLETLADREQTSLNQYIIYALTRQVTQAYLVHEHSDDSLDKQRKEFSELQQKLGQASPEAISRLLAEREVVVPEQELNPKIIKQLQARIRNRPAMSHRKDSVTDKEARRIRKAS